MKKSIRPSAVEGEVGAPASKSMMLRAVAAAVLSEGRWTKILNPSFCEDAAAALAVAESLGATVLRHKRSVSIFGSSHPVAKELQCGDSGLCLRMFAAIAALWPEELILTGNKRLLERPAAMLERPIRELGGFCDTRRGFPPVRIRGPLRGGRTTLDGSVSSQFLTGLLLALPKARGDSVLEVKNLKSRPYIDLTLSLLQKIKIKLERRGYEFFGIPGRQNYDLGKFTVEGDWSGAAFLLVAGALAGKIRVSGLDPLSAQGDRAILQVLNSAGAKVKIDGRGISVERANLKAFAFDATESPDLFPPLTSLACYCHGTSRLTGTERLKHKESDRGLALAQEFSRLGAAVRLERNVMAITGAQLNGGVVQSHGDHRIAMALAVAALAASGEVIIEESQSVAKSYPGFFEDLAAIGGKIHE
jgi:3-phosphoshikimate 1-carboxyvinyltransferase